MLYSGDVRIVGSRSIFQLFLPPVGTCFQSSEFLHISPLDAASAFAGLAGDGTMTIVVNPDDYTAQEINSIPAPLGLWFLRRLAIDAETRLSAAPRLAAQEEESLQTRRNFLALLRLDDVQLLVVSDQESHDYCAENAIQAVLSPPPVRDGLGVAGRPSGLAGKISSFVNRNDYSRVFLDGGRWALSSVEMHDGFDHDMFLATTHAVVVGESIANSLPYETAVSLSVGHTVLSGPLGPRWGLEPGLDYIEYSTPEELYRIVEHTVRNPSSTQLMATRGRSKSEVFRASSIFARLIGGGRETAV